MGCGFSSPNIAVVLSSSGAPPQIQGALQLRNNTTLSAIISADTLAWRQIKR
ncbi:hypothetical protein [Aetokthonos hydrillicola]|uniref:hypothetical protein n=1 Tax=Aetokthonos hydrillicola TaxID=1550245 RepID=UPI001ABB500C|nr:hypothetical protein [Aetokthonos hydrillicola]